MAFAIRQPNGGKRLANQNNCLGTEVVHRPQHKRFPIRNWSMLEATTEVSAIEPVSVFAELFRLQYKVAEHCKVLLALLFAWF